MERTFTEQELVRREKLKNIKKPYPEKYETNYSIKEASTLEDGVTFTIFPSKSFACL